MTQPTTLRRDGERPLLLDLFSCAGRAYLATLAPALEVAA
jgi:hypothetical protein